MKRRYLPSAEYRPIVLPGKYCILQAIYRYCRFIGYLQAYSCILPAY